MKPLHNFGAPMAVRAIQAALNEARQDGLVVWAAVRLAQDPDTVYAGRVRQLLPPGDGLLTWRLFVDLAFHADSPRVVHLGKRGVRDGRDEVLVLHVGADIEPTRLSAPYDAVRQALKE